MDNKLVEIIHSDQKNEKRSWIKHIKPGHTVHLNLITQDKNKQKIQPFQGLITKKQGDSLANKSFTIRKIVDKVSVELTLPLNLPSIKDVELEHVGKVRRAKLNYLRDKIGRKESRLKTKKITINTKKKRTKTKEKTSTPAIQ